MNKTISDIAAAVSWIRNYHNRNISITEGLARIVLNQRVSGSILSANTGEMTSLVFQVYYNSMRTAESSLTPRLPLFYFLRAANNCGHLFVE